MTSKFFLSAASLVAILVMAIPQPASAQANGPVLWKSQGGDTFQVLNRQRTATGGWQLTIRGASGTGTIALQGAKAVMTINLDLSRFRIEGNAPRTRRIEGTYANDRFTFGNQVYSRVQPAGQAPKPPKPAAAPARPANQQGPSQITYVDPNGDQGTLLRQANGTWVDPDGDVKLQVTRQDASGLLLSDLQKGIQAQVDLKNQIISVTKNGQVLLRHRIVSVK